jgi:hypothetical protein
MSNGEHITADADHIFVYSDEVILQKEENGARKTFMHINTAFLMAWEMQR